MVRFPHSATVTWTEPATYDEDTATWTPGSEKSLTVEGRAMAQGESSLIVTDDGTEVKSKYKFISRPTPKGLRIPYGAKIHINFTESSTYDGMLIRHNPFQVFSEIWL